MAEDEVTPDVPAEAPETTPEVPETPEVPDKGEGTTPEEVAKILKGSGMKLPKSAPKEEVVPDEVIPEAEADAVEEEPAEEEDEKEEPAKVETPAPEGKVFSIDVEDANGVTFKINAGDSLEDALKDFEPKNNGQILQILRDMDKLENEKNQYDADQVTQADAVAKEGRIADIRKGWDSEIQELQASKRLPATEAGKDNDRVAEVYKFMSEENTKRIEAGKPTIGSFEDALDKLENIEARTAKVEADKTERETARKNGGLVGGSSAPATTGTPVYKAGTARNSNDAIRKLGLLN